MTLCIAASAACNAPTHSASFLPNRAALKAARAPHSTVYVADFENGAPAIEEYRISDGTRVRRITDVPGRVLEMSVDAADTLYAVEEYIGQHGYGIVEYDAGRVAASRKILRNLKLPRTMLFDERGELMLLDQDAQRIFIYPRHATKPSRSIGAGLCQPFGMTRDVRGNLFVTDLCSKPGTYNPGAVTLYSPAGSLMRTITDAVRFPLDIAVDGLGKIYVADSFGTGKTGAPDYPTMNEYEESGGALLRSISLSADPAAILNAASPLADPFGNVYIELLGCERSSAGKHHCVDQIQMYAPGGAQPAWTLNAYPGAFLGDFAFDGKGNMYVVGRPQQQQPPSEIRVYSARTHAMHVLVHGRYFGVIAI